MCVHWHRPAKRDAETCGGARRTGDTGGSRAVYDGAMQRPRSWRGLGVAASLAAALTGGGCRPKQAEPEAPASPLAPTDVQQRPRATAPEVVAQARSPVELLPDTTVGVMSIAGVKALLAVVDLEAIIAKYRVQYNQAASFVTTNAGFNLLDPAQWREIGVDPDGPMGAAILDVRSESFAGFFTVADAGKLRAFLDKIGGESSRLIPVFEDRGTVLKVNPDSSFALVLRDGFAFVVGTDRPNQAPYDFARQLATMAPARGLTAAPRYVQAFAGGDGPAPLTGYLDLWAILAADQAAHEAREAAREPSWAEQELERAQSTPGSGEEVARLRQQIDEERRWQRQSAERRALQFQLLTKWFGQMSPLVFEFKGDRAGVLGKIRVKMPETMPLRAALRNAATPPPVLLALGERPVLALGGNFDVVPALAAFEDILRADGEDVEKFHEGLRGWLQIDLRTEILPVLTGSGGFALTVAEALMRGEGGHDEKLIGFSAAAAVNDPARAQALLERLVKRVPAKAGKERKTGAWTLEIPGYRTVYAAVVAGQIAVTTDLGVIQRLAAGTTTGTTKWIDTGVVPLLTARDAAMQGLFNVILPTFLLFRSRSDVSWGTTMLQQPHGAFPDVPAEKVDRVPQSRAYRAKLREWEGLNAKIKKEEAARERAQLMMMVQLAEAVGTMAGSLRERPDGLVLEGGQIFGKGGLTRAVDVMVDGLSGPRSGEKVYELYGSRSAVEEELRNIRITDVATALKVPRPML